MGHEGYVNSGFAMEGKKEGGSSREKEHTCNVSPRGLARRGDRWDAECGLKGTCQ